jgi:hypothetical protein
MKACAITSVELDEQRFAVIESSEYERYATSITYGATYVKDVVS